MISIPMSANCPKKDKMVVLNRRLALNLFPDSMRLSSNIGFSYTHQSIRELRHRPRPPLASPLLVGDQNRGRYRDRRISPDQDADDQREAETMQHLAAEKEQRKHGKESQARCQDGSTQCLINTFVDNVGQLVPPQQF